MKMIFLAAAALSSATAFANVQGNLESAAGSVETKEAKYYSIKRVVIEEVTDKDAQALATDSVGNFANCDASGTVTPNGEVPSVPGMENPLGMIDIIVDQIINTGRKIWAVIDAGRPVVNAKIDVAHALPKGLGCWTDLTNWKQPVSKTYRASYQNGFGMNVVDFSFRLNYIYGGSYKGQGQYIANASISPVKLDVAWGFTFNAGAEVPIVFNQGSAENPLAGMQVNLKWSVDTAIQHKESAEMFFAGGDGTFRRLVD